MIRIIYKQEERDSRLGARAVEALRRAVAGTTSKAAWAAYNGRRPVHADTLTSAEEAELLEHGFDVIMPDGERLGAEQEGA